MLTDFSSQLCLECGETEYEVSGDLLLTLNQIQFGGYERTATYFPASEDKTLQRSQFLASAKTVTST